MMVFDPRRSARRRVSDLNVLAWVGGLFFPTLPSSISSVWRALDSDACVEGEHKKDVSW